MGGGSYSSVSRSARAQSMGYTSNSVSFDSIFTQRRIDNDMDPKAVDVREARDSAEHPNSFPIILALDVTGSMESIPRMLVKNGFPTIMERIISGGISDPQVLFMGIGDSKCDSSPLQVGQFESSDELLDKWLTNIYFEAGGGGNGGESYALAWYFAALKTATDSMEKRGKKGILFTIGDDAVHKSISVEEIKRFVGNTEKSYNASELLAMAREKYDVYHIHVEHGYSRGDSRVSGSWKELLGENALVADSVDAIPSVIINTILGSKTSKPVKQTVSNPVKVKEEEIIL